MSAPTSGERPTTTRARELDAVIEFARADFMYFVELTCEPDRFRGARREGNIPIASAFELLSDPNPHTALIDYDQRGPVSVDLSLDRRQHFWKLEPNRKHLCQVQGVLLLCVGTKPHFVHTQVLIPAAAAWLEKFLYEVSAFPNISDDDQVDSISQVVANFEIAISRARRNKRNIG